jgi:hypothetical protein
MYVVGGQLHVPVDLSPGKARYPLYRWLGGHQSRFGRVRLKSSMPGFDPRTVQPVTKWRVFMTFQKCVIHVFSHPADRDITPDIGWKWNEITKFYVKECSVHFLRIRNQSAIYGNRWYQIPVTSEV